MSNEEVPIYVSDDSSSGTSSAAGSSVEKTPTLSEEQKLALEAAENGRNIFITGSAGVGKSFLLKEILKVLPMRSCYITASTGVAACNIGGTTLHSFAGIGLGEKSAPVLAMNIMRKTDVKSRWRAAQVLVIDEISMIDGHLFEKVEQVAKLVRGSSKPFGGIQIILCGDFLQLPPVKSSYFAFETKAWSEVVHETIVLKKVFRQKEVGFVTLLNRLRTGQFIPLDVKVLETCKKTTFVDDGIKATRLFPHRYSCDDLNSKELKKLKGTSEIYTAVDQATKPMYKEMLDKNSKFASRLELKIGAQVMLLVNKNVEGQLVNGARGVVIGIRDKSKSMQENIVMIQAANKDNESLGGTLKGKNLLEDTVIHDDDEDEEEAGDSSYEDMEEREAGFQRPPIVLFASGVVDVVNNERITIIAAGRTVASRVQIPLSLAWAVSVHKSQGMTLDRIDVSLSGSFEHGQSYVALSRVTSLDGLLLRDFNVKKITAHPKVLKYYRKYDPTFDKFTREGDEQLKEFVEGKRKMEGYDDVLKQIKDRNELNAACSSKDKINTSPVTNMARDLGTKNSPSDFQPFPSKTKSDTSPNSMKSSDKHLTGPEKVLNNNNDLCSDSKPGQPVEDSGSIMADIATTSSKTPLANTCTALMKAESILAHCRKTLEETKKEGPSNFFANEDADDPCEDNSKTSNNDVTIVADSDSEDTLPKNLPNPTEFDIRELDASVFEDDDFDESLLDNTHTHAPTTPSRNNFLDNICPDLLAKANSVSRDTTLHHISKRKRSVKEIGEKSPKRNNPLVSPPKEEEMRLLLKEKAAEIERKKQAALERRRRSMLQRSNR